MPEELLTVMGLPVLKRYAVEAGVPMYGLWDAAGKAMSFSSKVTLAGNAQLGWTRLTSTLC